VGGVASIGRALSQTFVVVSGPGRHHVVVSDRLIRPPLCSSSSNDDDDIALFVMRRDSPPSSVASGRSAAAVVVAGDGSGDTGVTVGGGAEDGVRVVDDAEVTQASQLLLSLASLKSSIKEMWEEGWRWKIV